MERKTADKKPAAVKAAQSYPTNGITLVCLAAINDVKDGERRLLIQDISDLLIFNQAK